MQEENMKEIVSGLDSSCETVVIDGSALGNPGVVIYLVRPSIRFVRHFFIFGVRQ